jgi:hypothetical protein
MSPEQALDTKHADARADIYSLGCTLYFLLTGRKPFDADTVMKRLMAHRVQPIPSLREARPETPALLDGVYRRMMAKELGNRYQTMEEVCRAMEACLPEARSSLGETSQFSEANRSGSSGESSGLKAFLQGLSSGAPGASGGTAVSAPPRVTVVTGDETHGSGNPMAHTLSRGEAVDVDKRIPVKASLQPRKRRSRTPFVAAVTVGITFSALAVWRLRVPSTTTEADARTAVAPAGTEIGVLAPTAESAATVDLLKLCKPKADRYGTWEFAGGVLQVGLKADSQSAGMAIDYEAPKEYELTAVVERLEGDNSFSIGATAGETRFRVDFDFNQDRRTVLNLVDGTIFGSREKGPRLTNGRLEQIRISVRSTGVRVLLNAQPLIEYAGGLERLSREPRDDEIYPKFFLRAASPYRLHKLELTPSAAEDAASGPQSRAASVDLLEIYRPKKDSFGEWKFVDGRFEASVAPSSQDSVVSCDYDAPQEYDLVAMAERLDGDKGIVFGLASGENLFQMMVEQGTDRRTEMIVGGRGVRTTAAGPFCVTGKVQEIRIRIRKDGAAMLVDGQVVLDHQGPLSELTRTRVVPGTFYLRVSNTYRFHRLELVPVDTTAVRPPRPTPAYLGVDDPAFQQWITNVAAMPAEEQAKSVSEKLMQLNPGFNGKLMGADGTATPTIENGIVTKVTCFSDDVVDISPLRAFAQLKLLKCYGNKTQGKLADLSPLRGLRLMKLDCRNTLVEDLSPLKELPLTELQVGSTKVTPASVAALQKALPNCKIEWDDPDKTP